MDALRLYGRLAATSVRAQMQYPASFLMLCAGHFAVTAIEFAGLMAVLSRFGNLKGWTAPQVGLLYGMISVSFGLAELLARGFDMFAPFVRAGDFDRVLLRPRSPALQIVGMEFHLRNLGRISQGALVLAWALATVRVDWTPAKLALLPAAIAGGACLFVGLFVLQATLCFWTVESLEIVNCATYGGVEAAKVPMSVYPRGFRLFFTLVVPLAAASFVPAELLLDRASGPIAWLSPLVGVAFLLASLQVFRLGVRHYRSTGS